jgi:3-methyladenine DNA glycosylase AlkC
MNQTYLFVSTTALDTTKEPKPEHIRYVPVSCTEQELPQAAQAVHQQHGLPVIGIVSKEMVVGMLQAIEVFEKGQ